MFRLVCVLVLVAVVRCGKMNRPPDNPAPAAVTPAAPQPARPSPSPERGTEKFTAELKALPEPNRYQVELHWETDERRSRFWILRQDDRETKTIAQLDPILRTFTDDTVVPGSSYQYVLTTEVPSDPAMRMATSVSIPRDLEVIGPLEMADTAGIHRLFLRAKAEIRPRHQALTLVVDELIVETGATFRARPAGSQGLPGWDAGFAPGIFVKARTASGDLRFIADGDRGGQGLAGAAGAAGVPGAQGRPSEFEIKPSRDTDRYVCKYEAGNGGPGGTGSPGRVGGKGGRGGSSAPIFLRVDHAPDFHASVSAEPGAGGEGGPGGPGGMGGPGGPPGITYSPCRQLAQPGLPGPRGASGSAGEKGEVGTQSPWCLKINRSVFGTCRADSPEPNWKL